MSIFAKTRFIRHLLAAVLLLPLLCACSSGNDFDAPEYPDTTEKYITLSIVVSAGGKSATRAPQGGENGDGREAGFKRENEVTGITLMLYPVDGDEDNINSSRSKQIAFVKHFPVTEVTGSRKQEGSSYVEKTDEVIYTTGEQPLTEFPSAGKYRAIVVANLNLENTFTTNSTVQDVCNATTSIVYNVGEGLRADAQNFVMASENNDVLIDLTQKPNPTGNRIVYNFDNIRIERLAARVDFWMNGATYKTRADNAAYTTPGYEYNVKKTNGTLSDDKFVLTAVTPFNLYNNDAEEYFIKRTNDAKPYLADETTENYVIDPLTNSGKTADNYKNPLSTLVGYDKSNGRLAGAAGFYQTTQSLYANIPTADASEDVKKSSQHAPFTENNKTYNHNFILCYPKENTLLPSTPLYYYATGVAIEGDYYKGGTGNPKHLIYYGFLRHQGENSSGNYTIQAADDLDERYTYGNDENHITPMNFGVVRNNIYRISIDKITEKDPPDTPTPDPPTITWKIMVKNWDVFEHKTIFM